VSYQIAEIGRNQLVALAGLAPFANDSGTSKGKRSIFGGRAKVRRCLYMAAVSAASHNASFENTVAIKKRGKPFKCAIVAAMRKLLLCMQSLAKNPGKILAENAKKDEEFA
jgi:transposase